MPNRESLIEEDGKPVPDEDTNQPEATTVEAVYEAIGDAYDSLYMDRDCLAENTLLGSMLARALPEDEIIIDVGCGTGLLLELVQTERYIGLDPCPKMIAKLKEKHPDADVMIGRYEDTIVPKRGVRVGLFGSPSYVSPKVLDIPNLNQYFFMFYSPGYWPKYYVDGSVGKYPGYEFSDFDVGDSFVTRFSNYMIVTDLL